MTVKLVRNANGSSDQTKTERKRRREERGNGAAPSLILPLQLPDEHPPDHHPWGPLSSTQQLAVPHLLTIGYSQASATTSLSLTGGSIL